MAIYFRFSLLLLAIIFAFHYAMPRHYATLRYHYWHWCFHIDTDVDIADILRYIIRYWAFLLMPLSLLLHFSFRHFHCRDIALYFYHYNSHTPLAFAITFSLSHISLIHYLLYYIDIISYVAAAIFITLLSPLLLKDWIFACLHIIIRHWVFFAIIDSFITPLLFRYALRHWWCRFRHVIISFFITLVTLSSMRWCRYISLFIVTPLRWFSSAWYFDYYYWLITPLFRFHIFFADYGHFQPLRLFSPAIFFRCRFDIISLPLLFSFSSYFLRRHYIVIITVIIAYAWYWLPLYCMSPDTTYYIRWCWYSLRHRISENIAEAL